MGFVKIENELFKLTDKPHSLNYGEICLLAFISNYSKGNRFFMTNKLIATSLNTSERTIKRWIANLRDKKLILIHYEEVAGKEKRIIVPTFAK